jgi:hypothetical protein
MTGPQPQEVRNAADIAVLSDQLTGIRARIDELALQVDGIAGTIEGQRDVLRSVENLKETVDQLVRRWNALFPPEDPDARFYSPIATPRFWTLTGRGRELAIERLRAWVDAVYKSQFGFLARKLPACWEQHDFCLVVLDVASELHSCLYLQPTRNQGLLSGQAELLTRLMPALADLMASEGKCEHTQRNAYEINRAAGNGARR